MKITLLWILPLAAKVVLARPAPDDEWDLIASAFDGGELAKGGKCITSQSGGNIMNGICSNSIQSGRVLYTTDSCGGAKCSVPSPRCDVPGYGSGRGWCMDPQSECTSTDGQNGQPGRPGQIVNGYCYEEGIKCCDGRVQAAVSSFLPSQFNDASLPPTIDGQFNDNDGVLPSVDDQFSNFANINPDDGFFNFPSDGSEQIGFLDGAPNDLFASNEFGSNEFAFNDVGYPNDNGFSNDNLFAANNDANWFGA